MPICDTCGNKETFVKLCVAGHIVQYDPESGDETFSHDEYTWGHELTVDCDGEKRRVSEELVCAECESRDVN